MTGVLRAGRCSSCGTPLTGHFDARNAFVPCSVLQDRELEPDAGVVDAIRRRLRARLARPPQASTEPPQPRSERRAQPPFQACVLALGAVR